MNLNPFKKADAPANLMSTPIPEWVSVFDACAQASFQAINRCMKIDNPTLADEFLQTEDGKVLMRSLKGYALFVLGKSINA